MASVFLVCGHAQWFCADPGPGGPRDLHQAARKRYRRTSATASGVME